VPKPVSISAWQSGGRDTPTTAGSEHSSRSEELDRAAAVAGHVSDSLPVYGRWNVARGSIPTARPVIMVYGRCVRPVSPALACAACKSSIGDFLCAEKWDTKLLGALCIHVLL